MYIHSQSETEGFFNRHTYTGLIDVLAVLLNRFMKCAVKLKRDPVRQRSEQWTSEHSLYNSQHTEEEYTHTQPPLSSARLAVHFISDPDLRAAVYFESVWENKTAPFYLLVRTVYLQCLGYQRMISEHSFTSTSL